MTQESVNEKPVSDEEPVSGDAPKGDEPKGDEPKSELTKEQVQQMIAEATTQAVTEAKDAGRRELQGEQDRNRNVERRARLAESRVNSYETSFKSLDEETQKDIELARYREQDKYYQSTAQEEAQKQQETDFWGRVNNQLLTSLDNLEIPRDDKRLDWGDGAKDLPEARGRFDNSVAKILKENRKVVEDKQRDDFKTLESKLRKDLGLDSVDTTQGSGGGGDTDADFKRDWGSGALPNTKGNIERARKLATA